MPLRGAGPIDEIELVFDRDHRRQIEAMQSVESVGFDVERSGRLARAFPLTAVIGQDMIKQVGAWVECWVLEPHTSRGRVV